MCKVRLPNIAQYVSRILQNEPFLWCRRLHTSSLLIWYGVRRGTIRFISEKKNMWFSAERQETSENRRKLKVWTDQIRRILQIEVLRIFTVGLLNSTELSLTVSKCWLFSHPPKYLSLLRSFCFIWFRKKPGKVTAHMSVHQYIKSSEIFGHI